MPTLPREGAYLWNSFIDLHSTRGGGFGPAAITFVEIEAWSRLTASPLEPWEVSIIRAIDDAYLESLLPEQPR